MKFVCDCGNDNIEEFEFIPEYDEEDYGDNSDEELLGINIMCKNCKATMYLKPDSIEIYYSDNKKPYIKYW